jgi:prefoldin subunit 5
MKLVKQKDGTIVKVQEISTVISIEVINARIAGLNSTIENLQLELKELEEAKKEIEELSK